MCRTFETPTESNLDENSLLYDRKTHSYHRIIHKLKLFDNIYYEISSNVENLMDGSLSNLIPLDSLILRYEVVEDDNE